MHVINYFSTIKLVIVLLLLLFSQFGVFDTTLGFDFETFFPTCEASGNSPQDIDVAGITNQIYSFSSPGFNTDNR